MREAGSGNSKTSGEHGLRVRRRDVIKLGAGVIAGAVAASRAAAQDAVPGEATIPKGALPPNVWRPHTGAGYKYDANRMDNNGPMDDTTRKIVKWVHEFGPAQMTPNVVTRCNRAMVDSLGAVVAAFEEDAVRVAARTAALFPGGPLKSTVFGYGIVTNPEHAAFVNSAMVRLVDFNDTGQGGHISNLIPAAFAIGEALHSTGAEVLAATAVGYEIQSLGFGESVAPAMAAGKLMKLDEDKLANALTIALTPHVALNKGVGALSMWKGVRSAEAIKCGVWAAILAREGMTGPPQPFEGRGAYNYYRGSLGRDFKLPVEPKLQIERMVNKAVPTDQQNQQAVDLLPEMRAWTKYDDIASFEYFMPFSSWEEVADNPKWDPRNRDTADHSIPYVLARGLIEGEPYLDAFLDEKLPYKDPVVRALMEKMTFAPVAGWQGQGTAHIRITKKSGEVRTWDTFGGSRNPGDMSEYPQMTEDEISAKFKRVCAYKHVDNAQRDRVLAQWWNLSAVKDFADAMKTLANYGRPRPLQTA